MRLFIGLKPSEGFRDALSLLQSRLQAAGVGARYLDPSNLHLTLAFIGEWPDNPTHLLPRVEQLFPLRLSHVGLFPEARVIWAGVESSAALDQLAQDVRNSLGGAGIPFDPKPFVPHITLGRKPVVPPGFSLGQIEVPQAEMTVSDVCLYRSVREETGMVYSVIGCASGKEGDAS